jgi:hypothetical protein
MYEYTDENMLIYFLCGAEYCLIFQNIPDFYYTFKGLWGSVDFLNGVKCVFLGMIVYTSKILCTGGGDHQCLCDVIDWLRLWDGIVDESILMELRLLIGALVL